VQGIATVVAHLSGVGALVDQDLTKGGKKERGSYLGINNGFKKCMSNFARVEYEGNDFKCENGPKNQIKESCFS